MHRSHKQLRNVRHRRQRPSGAPCWQRRPVRPCRNRRKRQQAVRHVQGDPLTPSRPGVQSSPSGYVQPVPFVFLDRIMDALGPSTNPRVLREDSRFRDRLSVLSSPGRVHHRRLHDLKAGRLNGEWATRRPAPATPWSCTASSAAPCRRHTASPGDLLRGGVHRCGGAADVSSVIGLPRSCSRWSFGGSALPSVTEQGDDVV